MARRTTFTRCTTIALESVSSRVLAPLGLREVLQLKALEDCSAVLRRWGSLVAHFFLNLVRQPRRLSLVGHLGFLRRSIVGGKYT